MTDYNDDDYADQDHDTDLVKTLRKALRERDKQITELTGTVETYRTKERVTTIADVLKAKGVKPKVAALMPKDIEATEESVQKWLDEYADVFGIQQNPADAPEDKPVAPGLPQEQRQAIETAMRTEASGEAVTDLGIERSRKVLSGIDENSSFDELMNTLRAEGLVR